MKWEDYDQTRNWLLVPKFSRWTRGRRFVSREGLENIQVAYKCVLDEGQRIIEQQQQSVYHIQWSSESTRFFVSVYTFDAISDLLSNLSQLLEIETCCNPLWLVGRWHGQHESHVSNKGEQHCDLHQRVCNETIVHYHLVFSSNVSWPRIGGGARQKFVRHKQPIYLKHGSLWPKGSLLPRSRGPNVTSTPSTARGCVHAQYMRRFYIGEPKARSYSPPKQSSRPLQRKEETRTTEQVFRFSDHCLQRSFVILAKIVWRLLGLHVRVLDILEIVSIWSLLFLTSWWCWNVEKQLLLHGTIRPYYKERIGRLALGTCSLEGVSYLPKGCSHSYVEEELITRGELK